MRVYKATYNFEIATDCQQALLSVASWTWRQCHGWGSDSCA